MALHVFVFLLVVCLLLSLARLGRLCWFHLRPSHSRGGAIHSTAQRLLKPRTPLDCPDCRLSCANSSIVEHAPTPVRPWSEVKSRRGAPKRIQTEGFACPNQQCPYFGITDDRIHALVGDGKHGRAEGIQTFRCQACRTTFTSRRNTALYRLKTSSHQIAMVLSALAEGLDASAAERVFGYHQATITTWLVRAGGHAEILHQRCFHNLQIPHLQLDELRTRLRSAKQVLWLWLAIDPCTKLLPVLQLGPRTQNMAHLLIHTLRQSLAPGCLPLFTSDGLNLYLQGLGFSGRLNTAFIERANLTVRHGVAALARRTWATSQQSPHLLAHLEWWRAYYHFVRPHASLRMTLVQPCKRGGNRQAQYYRQRTPAMAAGRTTRRWTARDVLYSPLPPVPCSAW